MPPVKNDLDDELMERISDRFERRLSDETSRLRGEMSDLRVEMREGFAMLRGDMAHDRFELLKWVFVFSVGQFFAIAGLLMALTHR